MSPDKPDELLHNIHYRKAFVDVMYGKDNRAIVLNLANNSMTDEIIVHLDAGFPINYELNDEGWTLLHAAAFTGD